MPLSAPLCDQVNLDTLSVERARTFAGFPFAATFLVAKPSYTLRGFTVIGANDQVDGVERGAVLRGKRLDVAQGKHLTVIGVIRVLWHRGDVVNGVIVPEWFEIRVTN